MNYKITENQPVYITSKTKRTHNIGQIGHVLEVLKYGYICIRMKKNGLNYAFHERELAPLRAAIPQ